MITSYKPVMKTTVVLFALVVASLAQAPPELQAKLNRKAAELGRDSQSLVREAVERLVNYDEWFIREVETGLAAADHGEFVEHDEVGRLIDNRYPG